ncbi:30S ribosomal protein S12 methylthiotransferase RimO [Prolixibacteraceae bacterium JC049]|nr:30S ribosomal protein S12 methylthiotransferase RimO [Prolixibacteraceae bacterium JC049]
MKRKVNVVTLGCSKNLVDSEVLLSQLGNSGFEVVHDSNDPTEVVIINTCGFIGDAKEESIDTIMNFVNAKEQGIIEKLYVMGCLSARYKDELVAEIPEVDKYFGKFDIKQITAELKVEYNPEFIYERKLTTPKHFAFLKISEGCNRSCSFCAIPIMTGKHKSRTIEELVREAKYLAKRGVKEVLLIAQDLSFYGLDLYGKSKLASLMEQLSEIEGIEWIRLHYAYPSKFPFDVLPVMRDNPKVCKYLDLPLQHASNNMLKKMLRHVTEEETYELIRRIREEVPGIALRTTLLVGHPGETEEDIERLKKMVEFARFDRLGVFPYSHEEGTYAAKHYEDDVDDDVKQARADEIMELQQNISADIMAERIGKKMKVLVDRTEGDMLVGRTEFDSPEVDGEVFITNYPDDLEIGDFCMVEITGSEDYDLIGEVK